MGGESRRQSHIIFTLLLIALVPFIPGESARKRHAWFALCVVVAASFATGPSRILKEEHNVGGYSHWSLYSHNYPLHTLGIDVSSEEWRGRTLEEIGAIFREGEKKVQGSDSILLPGASLYDLNSDGEHVYIRVYDFMTHMAGGYVGLPVDYRLGDGKVGGAGGGEGVAGGIE